ncbi:regulatory protein GemA [Sagittula sp. NFXS13]|uniref:gp16 family protein n=1 Tax=Sagittula sp. NFXS13 TaxID=2819095 RepID=UPI0032DEFC54
MSHQIIRTIHAGCKQLGLDKDTRRDLQLAVVGKASLGDMTDAEKQAVVAELKRRGFKPTGRGKGRFKAASRRDVRLIFVLWRALGDAGELNDPTSKGLHAFVRSQFEQTWGTVPIDINTMTDPSQIEAVIQALRSWINRTGVDFDWGQVSR